MNPEANPTSDVSNEVLERIAERLFRFLSGLATQPSARTQLAKAGMSDDDVAEGNALLKALLPPVLPALPADRASTAAQAAVAELDQIDGELLDRLRAPLQRYYPDIATFLLQGLNAAQGRAAVNTVATLCTRLDLLETDPEGQRAASRDRDRAALELIARRGIDKAYRSRLAELVKTALQPSMSVATETDDPNKRRAKLIAAKLWFDDWSTVARATIRNRNQLIALGLASRRSAKPKATVPTPEPEDEET